MTATSKSIEAIVKEWTAFDMKAIQRELDVTTTEITVRADQSDESRKKLIDLTREFRKNTSEETRKTVAPILKAFQGEVDSLSKRSKAAEKAFLEIYRLLTELKDPVPALEYAQSLQKRAEKVSDLEIENSKLRETLDEYNVEFATVKNQEVTIKQLREKIKELEDRFESNVQQKVKEKEKELQRQFSDKERQIQSQQFEFMTKFSEMELRQKQFQSLLDQAHQETFDYKSKLDELNNGRSSEIEIFSQDLERANERASNAERLVDRLREQLAEVEGNLTKVPSEEQNDQQRRIREKLEFDLAAKEREIAALVVDTQKLHSTLIKVKETSLGQIADLENLLSNKENVISQLEARLHCQSDYDEIKRELTILKSIEFPNSTRSADENSTKKSLEVLLLEKNRLLQNEQTQIKVANSELEKRCTDLEKTLNEVQNANFDLKKLNVQLEKDLLNVGRFGNVVRREPEGQTNENVLSNETEIIKDILNQSSSLSVEPSIPSSSDEALTAIVISQRERFRLRNVELENENLSLKQQTQFFQNEMDKIRSENIKLCSELKFVKNYPNSRKNDSTSNAYMQEYENSMDPFTTFKRQEQQKKYKSLKFHEKFALNLGNFILSSHKSRTFFVIYFALVHILIFLSLYRIVHVGAPVRDVSQICFDKFREHMAGVHGEKNFLLENVPGHNHR